MPTKKFEPGVSGNPFGRPRDKTPATMLRKAISDDMPEIIKTLVGQAKNGDTAAAKILLDRCVPTLKPYAMPVNLPKQNSLTGQGNEIITAVMSGQIPPDIASQLLSALAHQLRIVEIDELSKRVEALEIVR